MSPLLPVSWHPRPDPTAPVSVAVRGAVASRLARRLLLRSEEELGRLQGVSSRDLLVVSGPPELLPWVDGALYLGRDASAPLLLVPTTLQPSVPIALFERALRAAYPAVSPPVAVLAPWSLLVSLDTARSIELDRLRAWLEGEK